MSGRWVAVFLLVVGAYPASAQTPDPPPFAWTFLPTYDYHLSIEHLSSDDPRFVWDSHYGGEIGVVSYGPARFNIVADYQATLGEQLQLFDPNQGNYTLGGFTGVTWRGIETSLVMQHVSRHLGDRPKIHAIAWNMYGGRVAKRHDSGALHVTAQGDLRWTTQKSFVDYDWELDLQGRGRYVVGPVVELTGWAQLRRIGVDGSRNRGTQTAFRTEGGVRFNGRAAALELYAGVERRVDPFPTEFSTDTWALAGMRIISR